VAVLPPTIDFTVTVEKMRQKTVVSKKTTKEKPLISKSDLQKQIENKSLL
jgi:hypothetical protein